MAFLRLKWLAAAAVLALAWVLAQGLPEGQGKALVEQRCSVCHGLEVITSNRLSAAEWDAVVGSMINTGAQLNDAERKVVVAYLAASFGKEAAAPAGEGAKVYAACQGCHQANGTGVPGVFPPLAGHVPQILAAKGGREYLIHVLLYGLGGEISVKGTKYNGAMPAFGQLKDADLAALLNHISTSWGNQLPAGQQAFTAAEVKAQRAKPLAAPQVNAERAKLGLK